MRGIAAIAVLVRHAGPVCAPWFQHGYLAVDLFFILSGYVIARVYEPHLSAGLRLSDYGRRRLQRLYPMLFFGGLLGVALYQAGASDFRPESAYDWRLSVAAHFALVPFMTSYMGAFAFNGTQWSIVFELIANAIHATLRPHLTTSVLITLVSVSGLACVALTLERGSLNFGWHPGDFLLGLPRVGFGYFLGVLLFRLEPLWRNRVTPRPFAVVAVLFTIVATGPLSILPETLGWAAYDLLAVVLLFPGIVMIAVRAEGGRIAHGLGTLSYPLYAIHLPLLIAMGVTGWSLSAQLAALPVIVILAWMLGHWIDEPLNARRRVKPGVGKDAAPLVPVAAKG